MRIALPPELQDVSYLAKLFDLPVPKDAVCRKITGIATHSAEVERGDLFVCLDGAHASGADYARQAIANGANALLASRSRLPCGTTSIFCCENVQETLLRAAAAYRAEVGVKVVAVSGSAGKTTVKEAIAAVLGDVPHSEGNFNSCIGMPLSVLSLPRAAYWVLELGINHPGEMRKMARALRPDVAVLTNVGSAHIGAFGDFATLLSEKMELARALREEGILLLPSELPTALFAPPTCRILRVGTGHGADVTLGEVHSDAMGVYATVTAQKREIKRLFWPVPGSIGVSVIGHAASVGILCDRSDEEIREGLCRAGDKTPRMQRIGVGDILIINDCYNASPEAMIASLEVLSHVAGGRPAVAVLGDMLELGAYAPPLHDAVGVFVARLGIYALYTYGEEATTIASGAARQGMPRSRIRQYRTDERDALVQDLIRGLPRNAVVLFKASHGMCLEEIVKRVREEL